jgi:poly[(R)-3-hydroxyalkanoate] polymerase subunit PhaC
MPSKEQQQESGTEDKLQQWKDLGAQSQRVISAFIERQKGGDDFSVSDPKSIGNAFMEMNAKLLADPMKLAEAQQQLLKDSLLLWQNTMRRMAGQEVESIFEPEPGDRRFKKAAWDEELTFDYIKQSYLLTSRWTQSLVSDVEGLDPGTKEKVDFYSRQFISAMSPTNFATTNPAVMKSVHETGGQNLLDGLKNILGDIERGNGELKVSMTDLDAFTVGENVATTPGKVILQNDLMQLIQYDPTTEEVYKRPLLIVPPWINKYYVLDLQPKNSFIKWILDQGYTLFIISWANPTEKLAHKHFGDYMLEGPLAAIDAIEKATGEKEINALGFCIGGILLEATLAWMAAKGDDRIKSATLLATMLDFQEVGEVSVFVDDELVKSLEKHVGEKGYLDGKHMAQMFNMMRENDLIWSFVVNNYLLGHEPMPFDLLYWNSDSTRLPAEMLLYYLKKVYLENGLIKPDYLELNGEKINVTRIKTPTYVLATKEDHIAPWVSCYPVTQAFSGPVRFVLGGSGHIAGIVNPPAAKKYAYWTHSKHPADPQRWLDQAKEHVGSWWTDWDKWLTKHSKEKVPARIPGAGELSIIEDAPGSYVKATNSD